MRSCDSSGYGRESSTVIANTNNGLTTIIETNNDVDNKLGGDITISEDGYTAIAKPSKYATFEGWYTQDEVKITEENKETYGVVSLDSHSITISGKTNLIVSARFEQNYTVTYQMNTSGLSNTSEVQLPVGIMDSGLDDNRQEGSDESQEGLGYKKGYRYLVKNVPENSLDLKKAKATFQGWNTKSDGSGNTY